MKNKKLGMGLSSLLGAKIVKNEPVTEIKSQNNEKNLLFISIEKIIRDPDQPRKQFNEDKIKELQKGESSNNILAAPDKLVPVKPFRVHG